MLNSSNACYHSVQNLLSYVLCINIDNRAHRTIIFVLLYEYELGLSLWGMDRNCGYLSTWWERRIFVCKREDVTGGWRELRGVVLLISDSLPDVRV